MVLDNVDRPVKNDNAFIEKLDAKHVAFAERRLNSDVSEHLLNPEAYHVISSPPGGIALQEEYSSPPRELAEEGPSFHEFEVILRRQFHDRKEEPNISGRR